MLSYQHAYHAGCFADVIKHFALTRILDYMVQKDKPLFYLETHAGRGIYDIHDKYAQKTGEALEGIMPLWAIRSQLPTVFSPYIESITNINQQYDAPVRQNTLKGSLTERLLLEQKPIKKENNLDYYPGSPAFAIDMLRSNDRLFLCELHPGEFNHLKQLKHMQKRVFCNNGDGIKQLTSELPPMERRGLIFIDPSYELKKEYREIPEAINAAYKRFSKGVYCLWYPLIDNKLHGQLIRGLERIDSNYLRMEFNLNSKQSVGMAGCGLFIINPPYTLASDLKVAGEVFKKVYNPGLSSCIISEKKI